MNGTFRALRAVVLGWLGAGCVHVGCALAATAGAGVGVHAQDVPRVTGVGSLDTMLYVVGLVQQWGLTVLITVVLTGVVVFYVSTWGRGLVGLGFEGSSAAWENFEGETLEEWMDEHPDGEWRDFPDGE